MSLPTPPEAPQKPAQKQEIPGNVYLYDKNDTSPIPLTYDVIDFGKPQGAASPLVGWAAGAFFAVGGLWNFFNLNGEGTIFCRNSFVRHWWPTYCSRFLYEWL